MFPLVLFTLGCSLDCFARRSYVRHPPPLVHCACSPEVIGDANGFALTANDTQRSLVQNFLDILYANHSYSTGGSNDYEWWHPPRTLGDSMNTRTCPPSGWWL